MKNAFYTACLLVLALFSAPAGGIRTSYAQEAEAPAAVSEDILVETRERPVTPDDPYIPLTYESASRMYWAVGKEDMDLKNNQYIDNFLLINECRLYQRFYHDDLQWQQIRDATRQMIQTQKSKFPVQFEIMLPIQVGRYNDEGQYFEVDPKSSVRDMRRLDISAGEFSGECAGRAMALAGYPHQVILILNRPFSLTRIPVPREVAAHYINETRSSLQNLTLTSQVHRYERVAYLRAKVTLMLFREMVNVDNTGMRAAIYSRMDGYEIYADPQKLKLLYAEDLSRKRPVRRPKAAVPAPAAPEAAPAPAPTVPQGRTP